MNTNANTHTLSPELEALARKRVNARIGFFTHACVYAVVVTGLNLLAFSQGKVWSLWPTAGWGFGLLMHGLGVFGLGPGSALRERLLQRERKRLSGH
ncbi:MAG: 2TM domain-containing protein [Hydrogenophaga sp.]|nr:2TM domain-containing protein [Hydrogenophaga sp.]